MQTKICSLCKIEKKLSDFTFRIDTLSYRSDCKVCHLEMIKHCSKAKPWKYLLFQIKQRCENLKNTSYKYYGGRGIQCLITEDEIKFLWFRDRAFELEKPSIDRIDNDGNYCIENCQFLEIGDNVRKRFEKLRFF
jgi:hypothetical protein